MAATARKKKPAAASAGAVMFRDQATGLEWSATLCDGENVTHKQAEEACAKLGPGWRLPTVKELFGIVDHTKRLPAIDKDNFPDTKSDWYWTSTLYAGDSDYAWIVYFGYGDVYAYNRGSYNACVRAVRASQS